MRTRKRKRWRARVSFLTSVLCAGAGTCVPAAFALADGSAPLHTMNLSSIQTHGSAMWWRVACLGPGGWHPLDPSWVPLPVPGAGKTYWGHGVRGLASPDSLLGVPYHRSWKMWRWFSLCLLLGKIVVCQCHRSCRYVEVASLCGVLPQVQLLDEVADLPVASMTGAWGRQCRKLRLSQLQC